MLSINLSDVNIAKIVSQDNGQVYSDPSINAQTFCSPSQGRRRLLASDTKGVAIYLNVIVYSAPNSVMLNTLSTNSANQQVALQGFARVMSNATGLSIQMIESYTSIELIIPPAKQTAFALTQTEVIIISVIAGCILLSALCKYRLYKKRRLRKAARAAIFISPSGKPASPIILKVNPMLVTTDVKPSPVDAEHVKPRTCCYCVPISEK
jgi:hypothetical protein